MHKVLPSNLWPHRMPFIVPAVAGKLGGRAIIRLIAELKDALVILVYFAFHASLGLLYLAFSIEETKWKGPISSSLRYYLSA